MNRSLWGFKGLKEICNIHPLFVHFPIALFPVTLLFYALGLFGGASYFLTAGRVSLYLAAVSGILTVATGLRARSTIRFNPALGRMVKTHQSIGLTILLCAVVLTLWSFFQEANRPRGSALFIAVLAFANYLILQNADIGSLMVYTQGAGVASKERLPEPEAAGVR